MISKRARYGMYRKGNSLPFSSSSISWACTPYPSTTLGPLSLPHHSRSPSPGLCLAFPMPHLHAELQEFCFFPQASLLTCPGPAACLLPGKDNQEPKFSIASAPFYIFNSEHLNLEANFPFFKQILNIAGSQKGRTGRDTGSLNPATSFNSITYIIPFIN